MERALVVRQLEAELGPVGANGQHLTCKIRDPSCRRFLDEQRTARIRTEPLLRFPETDELAVGRRVLARLCNRRLLLSAQVRDQQQERNGDDTPHEFGPFH
jgi:hypothetical protein